MLFTTPQKHTRVASPEDHPEMQAGTSSNEKTTWFKVTKALVLGNVALIYQKGTYNLE